MKHLPKSTLTEILNDPYGFTYKEMSEVIGEDKARALYAELYKQPFHKKNLSISTKKVYKSSDTEKYVYELKDKQSWYLKDNVGLISAVGKKCMKNTASLFMA